MERGSLQGTALGLERIVENTVIDLRETMDQFQGLCLVITGERNVPIDIINETRQTYKKNQDHFNKISAAKQLLEGKYRQYYRRDSQREREIRGIAFLAKTLHMKFAYILQEKEAKIKLKSKEEYAEAHRQQIPLTWFQSNENQVTLPRNLRSLNQLDYLTKFKLGFERRGQVIQSGMRSISLFTLSGKVTLIDTLQSRMRLREYDIIERYAEEELHGALTHLKEVPPSEVARIITRFTDSSEFLKLKCLLLRVRSEKDLEKEIMAKTDNVLHLMEMGEVRTLSI